MSESIKGADRFFLIAQTQPGFEGIASGEIAKRIKGAVVRGARTLPGKNGIVLFEAPGDAGSLATLRTVEDLFATVADLPDMPPAREGLRVLEEAARAMDVEAGMTLAQQVTPGRGGRGGLRFRVVSRQVGRAGYRRVEAQRAVERGIAARKDRRWRLVEEGGVEFWLTLLPDRGLLALRLTDARTRHREYRSEHLPASLRPSAAAALVWLTRPGPKDVFLDPMCGAGTVLIERAFAGRYGLILGGDIDPAAMAATQANIGPRYKPISVRRWDARRLPLDAASVDAVAVNLPFGRQIGSPAENASLYPDFLREAARVLRPVARLVALTGDTWSFDQALKQVDSLTRRESCRVQVLGRGAKIYVMEKM